MYFLLLPLPTSNLNWNFRVFIEILPCTTYYGQTHIQEKFELEEDNVIPLSLLFYRLMARKECGCLVMSVTGLQKNIIFLGCECVC